MAPFTEKTCNGLALCAGAGGLELGLRLALQHYRTVCFVERDAYAAATLVARMEDKALDEAPVWSDLATFNGHEWCNCVDIVTAGYPCQPFSASGKRLGEKDPRHLWPEVRRALYECGAPLLFAENVPGHINLGLETVRRDLQDMGFAVEAGVFSAAEIGASHIRKRLFLLAYADSKYVRDMASYIRGRWLSPDRFGEIPTVNTHCSEDMDFSLPHGDSKAESLFPPFPHDIAAWERRLAVSPHSQPAIFRGNDGLAGQLDKLRLSGNGVVPLAAAYAFCSLILDAAEGPS